VSRDQSKVLSFDGYGWFVWHVVVSNDRLDVILGQGTELKSNITCGAVTNDGLRVALGCDTTLHVHERWNLSNGYHYAADVDVATLPGMDGCGPITAMEFGLTNQEALKVSTQSGKQVTLYRAHDSHSVVWRVNG